MQRPTAKSKPSLDALRSSPVRGQLEPHDPKTPKGWRYLQTTDTVDQLKVLLPPATATMYEEILRLEAAELAKKSQVNWPRVLEIRHLKDRMIRKSQRLADANNPPTKRIGKGDAFVFQTIAAPSDFRLKEMEKWLRRNHPKLAVYYHHQHTVGSGSHTHTVRHKSSSCCVRCSRVGSAKSTTRSASPALSIPKGESSTPAQRVSMSVISEHIIAATKDPDTHTHSDSPTLSGTPPAEAERVISPPPLPHPLRSSLAPAGDSVLTLVDNSEEKPKDDFSPPKKTPSPERVGTFRPGLARRRSCLKRSGIADAAKTVSWADDTNWVDQVAKYTLAAQEALDSGQQWDEIRESYKEHMSKLDDLHRQVAQSLERLRLETEHFQQVDNSIRAQRASLEDIFGQMEQKQDQFLSKMHHVLDAVTRTVSICAEKKALEPVTEVNEITSNASAS